jgi:hypothetical protein
MKQVKDAGGHACDHAHVTITLAGMSHVQILLPHTTARSLSAELYNTFSYEESVQLLSLSYHEKCAPRALIASPHTRA